MGSVRVQTATSFASGSLHTEVISDLAGLAAIEADWQDLLLRTPLATSYASPAWVLTWLRHFEHKHGVHAVAVRRDGELVGLAPFAQSRFGAGRLGYRLLVSAGTEHGDYGEPLLGTDPVPVAEAIAEHLSQLVHRGNVAVNLRRLDDGGAMLPAIEKRDDVVRQPMGEVAHAAIVDFAPLDDPNAYLDRLARGHDIPRRMRRLGERSESLVYDSRDADVEGTLDDMRDMLRGRWEPGTGPRLFHTPALERFTREVIRAMVDSDVAHVSSLKADGKRIAITNVFRVADRYMSDAVSRAGPLRAGPGRAVRDAAHLVRRGRRPGRHAGRRLPLQAQVGQRRPHHPVAGGGGPGQARRAGAQRAAGGHEPAGSPPAPLGAALAASGRGIGAVSRQKLLMTALRTLLMVVGSEAS